MTFFLQTSCWNPTRASHEISKKRRILQPLRGPRAAVRAPQLLHRLHQAQQRRRKSHCPVQPPQFGPSPLALPQLGVTLHPGADPVICHLFLGVHPFPGPATPHPGSPGSCVRSQIALPLSRRKRVPYPTHRTTLTLPLGFTQCSGQRPEQHPVQSGPTAFSSTFLDFVSAFSRPFVLSFEHEFVEGRSADRRTWRISQWQRIKTAVRHHFLSN